MTVQDIFDELRAANLERVKAWRAANPGKLPRAADAWVSLEGELMTAEFFANDNGVLVDFSASRVKPEVSVVTQDADGDDVVIMVGGIDKINSLIARLQNAKRLIVRMEG